MMEDKRKVLIIDELLLNRSMLGEMIKNDYEVLQAKDSLQTIDIVRQHKETLALILMDFMLPEKDQSEIFHVMKEENLLHIIPIIVVTAMNRINDGLKIIEFEVADVISKPIEPALLHRRIQNVISAHQYNRLSPILREQYREDIGVMNQEVIGLSEKLKKCREENRLLHQTNKLDLLTDVYRRSSIQELVKEHFQKNEGIPCAILLIEFSNMDIINEKYSIEKGKKLLQIFGKILKAHFSEFDYIGRVDSDCFLVLVTNFTDADFLRKKAKSIISMVKNADTELEDNDSISVGIGSALYPKNGKRYEELILEARKMLNHGKHGSGTYSLLNSFFMLDDDMVVECSNGTEFFSKAHSMLSNSQKKEYLFIRVDFPGFKKYAERNGFVEGERLLALIEKEIRTFVGDKGVCGKIYTDTFGMCMEAKEKELEQFMEELEVKIFRKDTEVNLAPYCGVYKVANQKISVEEMCNYAGIACQKAKKNKDHKIVVYHSQSS